MDAQMTLVTGVANKGDGRHMSRLVVISRQRAHASVISSGKYFDLSLLRAPGPRSQLLGRGDVEAGIGALGPAAVYSEIARLKGRVSTFGDQLDTFADWLVHTAFYATLGTGVARADGQELWLWLGWAAAGCTIDYFSRIVTGMRSKRAGAAPSPGKTAARARRGRRAGLLGPSVFR